MMSCPSLSASGHGHLHHPQTIYSYRVDVTQSCGRAVFSLRASDHEHLQPVLHTAYMLTTQLPQLDGDSLSASAPPTSRSPTHKLDQTHHRIMLSMCVTRAGIHKGCMKQKAPWSGCRRLVFTEA